jgi:hypothetical protein
VSTNELPKHKTVYMVEEKKGHMQFGMWTTLNKAEIDAGLQQGRGFSVKIRKMLVEPQSYARLILREK